jgi:hypothetical protein
MTTTGSDIAATMPDRWAFEAIARHLDVTRLLPAHSPYAGLGQSSSASYWAVLALTGLVLATASYGVLRRRAR